MKYLLSKAVDATNKSRGDTRDPAVARKQGTRFAVLGMATLLTGQKLPALSMFGRGVTLLEQSWRAKHPEFQGGLGERVKASVAFYEQTHQNQTNRFLHVVGIPMIVGGAVGLLATPSFSPPWVASAGLFTTGWALNIAGHALYEKNKPAFADDPLAFMMGPLWDTKQLITRARGKRTAA